MKKLTKKQKQIILDFGYQQEDLKYIEEALLFTDFELLIERQNDKKISLKKAKEILGETNFLSGIARSTFHYSAVREAGNGHKIYFNSSRNYES